MSIYIFDASLTFWSVINSNLDSVSVNPYLYVSLSCAKIPSLLSFGFLTSSIVLIPFGIPVILDFSGLPFNLNLWLFHEGTRGASLTIKLIRLLNVLAMEQENWIKVLLMFLDTGLYHRPCKETFSFNMSQASHSILSQFSWIELIFTDPASFQRISRVECNVIFVYFQKAKTSLLPVYMEIHSADPRCLIAPYEYLWLIY